MSIQIDYLADHPNFVAELARWHHQEWGHLRSGDSVQKRIGRLRDECDRGTIPTVLVAFDGSTLLGSAKLVVCDMDTRAELTPWLAGVFVAAPRRKTGVGSALVRRAVAEARSLRVPRLYLYTPDAEGFYSRLGWVVTERTKYRQAEVAVMAFDCAL